MSSAGKQSPELKNQARPASLQHMKAAHLSRRNFLQDSLVLAVPAILTAKSAATGAPNPQTPPTRPLRVLCVGAHPDDPESGCAGTLIRYSGSGHSVMIVYLTRGERGIRDKS